jgi:hypothetical protein
VRKIVNGYATTTGASNLMYVQNSPFGGSLALMINYDKARALGSPYYTISLHIILLFFLYTNFFFFYSVHVKYDGVLQGASWNDYKWDYVQNTWVVAIILFLFLF